VCGAFWEILIQRELSFKECMGVNWVLDQKLNISMNFVNKNYNTTTFSRDEIL
jgi:hypothetical protein